MNEYLDDACTLLSRAAKVISRGMMEEEVLHATIYFALGTERLLKSILFGINPIYVYKIQDFKNTFRLLYEDMLLPTAKPRKELSDKPNGDVLSFRESLDRARLISRTTEKHLSLLHWLRQSRDIIAHCPLSQFDVRKAETSLLRDFYPLVNDYSEELNYPVSRFTNNQEIRLCALSSELQDSMGRKIELKIQAHLKQWEQWEKEPGYFKKKLETTERLCIEKNLETMACPACENPAIVAIEPDWDYDLDEGTQWVTSILVTSLRCLFCKFEIADYEEIDFLDLNKKFMERYETEDDWSG